MNKQPLNNNLAQFFYWCAGVNRQLIISCPESEQQLKAGIGATVLFTALFATIASSFACLMVFHNLNLAMAFGLLWGAMIFNLDRLIVGGMHANINLPFKIGSLFIRLIMATVISVVISKPLELRIFADRISYEILEMKNEVSSDQSKTLEATHQIQFLANQGKDLSGTIQQLEKQKLEHPNNPSFIQMEKDQKSCDLALQQQEQSHGRKIATLQAEINTIYHTPSNYERKNSKRQFKSTSTRSRYYKLIAERNQLKKELRSARKACRHLAQQIHTAIQQHQVQIDQRLQHQRKLKEKLTGEQQQAQQSMRREKKQIDTIIAQSFKAGLVTQLEAMNRLLQKDRSLRYTAYFIMLLFWVVELTPILVKLVTSTSHYNLLEKYEAHRQKQQIAHEKKLDQGLMDKEQTLHQEESNTQLQHQLLLLRFSTFAKYCDQLENSQQVFQSFCQRWLLEIELLNSDVDKKEALLQLTRLQSSWRELIGEVEL